MIDSLKRLWKSSRLKRWVSLFLVGVSVSIAIASCTSIATDTDQVELMLVSYAATRDAYREIIPQFAQKWQQEHNQEVAFYESYGPSGAQTRSVIEGLEADVVALALGLDIEKIEEIGLIEPGWEKEVPNGAIAYQSVVVLATRPGNPKEIKRWEDLAKADLEVITANPKTSGGARWNFLALWGSVTETGGSEEEALEYTRAVFQNAPILPRDSREASAVFLKQSQGDVLINYENEAILAQQYGQKMSYTVPDANISVDSPVAVVDQNVDKHGNREVAEAFVEYLFTPEAQREFAKVGFRSVVPTVAKETADQYPPIKTLFTIEDFASWDEVQKRFFADGAIFDQIQTGIRQ